MDDYNFAPFHLFATEGHVHMDRDHEWDMQQLELIIAEGGPGLMTAHYRIVDLGSKDERLEACARWLERTARVGEGMVVKPLEFTVRGSHALVQPAIKVRGPEYLLIIFGPEYRREENLSRLRRGCSA